MVNLFSGVFDKLFDEENEVTSCAGLLYGFCTMLYVVPSTDNLGLIFSWEIIIKAFGGMILAVITAMMLKFGTDCYEYKIKPRIFKIKKDEKTKDSETNEAA